MKNHQLKESKKAAALKYNSAKDAAPKILASGKGLLAEKILELAKNKT
jgi:flagellar biosynthesis protein